MKCPVGLVVILNVPLLMSLCLSVCVYVYLSVYVCLYVCSESRCDIGEFWRFLSPYHQIPSSSSRWRLDCRLIMYLSFLLL